MLLLLLILLFVLTAFARQVTRVEQDVALFLGNDGMDGTFFEQLLIGFDDDRRRRGSGNKGPVRIVVVGTEESHQEEEAVDGGGGEIFHRLQMERRKGVRGKAKKERGGKQRDIVRQR